MDRDLLIISLLSLIVSSFTNSPSSSFMESSFIKQQKINSITSYFVILYIPNRISSGENCSFFCFKFLSIAFASVILEPDFDSSDLGMLPTTRSNEPL